MNTMTPEQRNERFSDLELKLNSLINRGLPRRAAGVCLDIISIVDTHGERQKYAKLRASLVRNSNRHNGQQSWYLAGQFNGGEM